MRIAIIGAGAVGSLLGHGFCLSGHRVTLIDRPRRLSELERLGGLVVLGSNGQHSIAVPDLIAARSEDVGHHDAIFLATKAQDLPAVAALVTPLLGQESFVVTVQNGIPWWYFQSLNHRLRNRRLVSVDPDGVLEREINPERIIGCVAYPAAILRPDGTVAHIEGNRFPVGELDGVERERTRRLVQLFVGAGFKSRALSDIRSEIWLKALGALSINPVSALTRATMSEICEFEPTRALVAEMMREARDIAESLGASFRHTIDERIEGARAVGHHKTSMLQDVEDNRPLELGALMEVILELAGLTGREATAVRSIYACAALLNAQVASSARRNEWACTEESVRG